MLIGFKFWKLLGLSEVVFAFNRRIAYYMRSLDICTETKNQCRGSDNTARTSAAVRCRRVNQLEHPANSTRLRSAAVFLSSTGRPAGGASRRGFAGGSGQPDPDAFPGGDRGPHGTGVVR